MRNIFKKIGVAAIAIGLTLSFTGCQTDAKVASKNLSKAAEMFEIERRIVFVNGITDRYMLTIEGKCSIEDQGNQLEVTCKVAPEKFKKHFLGLSDNVTYIAEQLETVNVNTFHHRVIFKPQSIIPDIDLRGDMGQLKDAVIPDSTD